MNTITLKGIIDEDFVNYKKTSMTLMFPNCSFKCGSEVCQNSALANQKNIVVNINDLRNRYLQNPISKAIVCQGLEPFDSFVELLNFISVIRVDNLDDIVIYTGYNPSEIDEQIKTLKEFPNIIVKFGRYYPYEDRHYDEVLGVYLSSDNQYAEKIS